VLAQHGLERWKERFPDRAVEIPHKKILQAAKHVTRLHEDFFVSTFLATYCCMKQRSGRVRIKTILWNLN
jgi:hypothetical protein